MRRYRIFFVFLSLIFLSLAFVWRAQAAVKLVSFTAIPDLENQKILLYWETGSELDFSGFYVQKSNSPDSGFERLLDPYGDHLFFPAAGDGGAGAQYYHEDNNVSVESWHFYRLEMIDLGGDTDFSDVVTVFLGNTPTPTATGTATLTTTTDPRTPTATRTPSATRTSTVPTSTRTKTRQPTATRTRTPSPFHAVTYTSRPRATSTLIDTPTVTPTQTISPTATTTLAPLPSLTLLFPVRTPTPTFTPSATVTSSPVPPSPTPTPKPENHIPLRVSFLWGIIILLWLTLAGFLFAYLRRMSR